MGGVAVVVGAVVAGGALIAKASGAFDSVGSVSIGVSDNEEHAKKIADELAEAKAKADENTLAFEKEVIDTINESMKQLIQYLEKINNNEYGGKSLNLNIDAMRTAFEDLKRNVVGSLGDTLNERLVLTDNELSEILKERDDKKRKKEFKLFVKKVEQEAFDNLRSRIEFTVRKQEQLIRGEIESRLNEIEKNMQSEEKAYDDIVKAKEKDETKMADMRIKYMYQYELTEILLDELGG